VTTLKVNTIEPAGSTLTLGASGDSVVLADDVKSNTYKDAGGNTLFTSDGSGNLSSVNSGFGDTIKLLSTTTASNSASIEFTLPTAYKQVKFGFYNVTPVSDSVSFKFDCSVSSSYGTTKTTTFFIAYHNEAGSDTSLSYQTSRDLAQGTDSQNLTVTTGNGADESAAGELILYNPASTTYVKHFVANTNSYDGNNYTLESFPAGYINTTSALDGIKFSMSSGNISSGTIKMYGIS